MHIRMLKPLDIRKEKEELTFKSQESTNFSYLSDVMVRQEAQSRHPGSTNYDDIECDVIVAGNGDVTTRPDINRLIARKRYVPKKRSLMHLVGSFERSLRACSRTVTFIALLLVIVINVLGGLIIIKLYERKSTVGTSASLPLFEYSMGISCRDSFLSILRKSSANILGIDEGLWPCLMIETNWNNNKRLKRRREVLHNTRIRDEGGYGHTGYSHRPPGCHGYAMRIMQSLARTFLAGKQLVTYIFLFADFWASSVFYLDSYTVNLELNDNFKVFYDRIYLYIYDVYRSWVSYDWATYPEAISGKTYTLVYFSSKVILLMIKSHDKYQSLILIGLAHAEKAYSRIRSISVHNRSYWREWRPLVTPWAWCIKEGTEPWRFQKRFIPSHVQVSLFLCSLLLLLLCFCFCCSYYCYYYYYYVYLLAKGFIITVVKETNLVLSIAMVKNTNLDILIAKLIPFLWFLFSLSLSLYLSLFPNGHCMCAGYLTHTISPAGLVALHKCRLSNLYNINSLAFPFRSSLSLSSQMAIVCVQAI